jgi:RND family efflux transporter MFP subunit
VIKQRASAFISFALMALVLSAAGCKRHEVGQGLPPASGSGVASPKIPALGDLTGSDDPDGGANERAGHFSGTGTLRASHEAELGPKVTGVLTEIRVDEGDKVKKGEVLFRTDSSQAASAVSQAKAGVASAQVALDSAKLDFNRTEQLYKSGAVAPATYDQVKSRYDGAGAAVDQAKAALSAAEQALADTVVRSPIDGVVTAKLKNVGEVATLMPPTTVLVVQDVVHLELRARLPERALGHIEPGDRIQVSLPALGVQRRIAVERVNPAVDPRSRTIEVIANVDNQDKKLKPGMLAEVSFDLPDAGPGVDPGATSRAGKP